MIGFDPASRIRRCGGIERAAAGECDLIVRGPGPGGARGYLYVGGRFQSDRAGRPTLSDRTLRLLASLSGRGFTYTCVPPGSGVRMGIDRGLDGVLDGDEAGGGR